MPKLINCFAAGLLFFYNTNAAFALGHARSETSAQSANDFKGKKVIEIVPAEDGKLIQLPDSSFYAFGRQFETRLKTRLINSQKFVVAEPAANESIQLFQNQIAPGYSWPASTTPSAKIIVTYEVVSFTTGKRGTRFFYGVDEKTPAFPNEFPIYSSENPSGPSHFMGRFQAKGKTNTGSQAGLEIADKLALNLGFTKLGFRFNPYRADIRLKIRISPTVSGKAKEKEVTVTTKGFYFDFEAGYEGLSGLIQIARRDAMIRAFDQAIDHSTVSIEELFNDVPITAKIDYVIKEKNRTVALLGTGGFSDIPQGQSFYIPGTDVELVSQLSTVDGTIAYVKSGNPDSLKPGLIVIDQKIQETNQLFANSIQQVPPLRINLSDQNITENSLKQEDLINQKGRITKLKSWVLNIFTLGYRVWRYYQYDQKFIVESAQNQGAVAASRINQTNNNQKERSTQLDHHALQKPDYDVEPDTTPIIAILDTGIDYNHRDLKNNIWSNPFPIANMKGEFDNHGWDFISGDNRPFDDAYHGTEVASAIVRVNQNVRIMPLKIFNPWGATRSGAILGAFQYAVKNGANIIVCAWSTPIDSQAIRQGIEYAMINNVIVVTSAGDNGFNLSRVPMYPAVLSFEYENLISVAALSRDGGLLYNEKSKSNFSPAFVQLGAIGEDIEVSDPRNKRDHVSSTRVATGVAVGMLAQNISEERLSLNHMPEYRVSIDRLLDHTYSDPELAPLIEEGRVLQFGSGIKR